MSRLENKVAIVTGAGTRSENVEGVGASTAKVFARNGAKVLIVDMDDQAADRTLTSIQDDGGQAAVFIGDVSNEGDCKGIVDAAVANFGTVDVLMNSVGIGGPGVTTEVTEESWYKVLDVDLKSTVFISKYAIPVMEKNGGGSIINVSSVDGIRAAMTRNIPYAAAKGGMITVTKAMAVHHGRQNIRVNCIAPGMLYTAMTAAMDDRRRQVRRDIAPLGTEGKAEDIAMAALFLASDESRWITGVLLPVDAGLMAAGPQSLLNNVLEDWEYV